MRPHFNTIDEYIQTFPEDVQAILQKIREAIRQEAPEATETISYQIPTFRLDGKNLIHFAAFKHHVGIYPIPSGTAAFHKAISPYIKGKGTMQFPLDKPVPYDSVKVIVSFHIARLAEQK